MITKQKDIHYCEHCGKKGMVKKIIEMHEEYCVKNPETYPRCFVNMRRRDSDECNHLEFVDQPTRTWGEEGEPMRWARCGVTGQLMHTTALLGKRAYFEKHRHLDVDKAESIEKVLSKSVLMPVECGDYEGNL